MTILTRDSDPWQFEELARRLDGESVSASCGRGSESSFHQWLCVYNLEKSRACYALSVQFFSRASMTNAKAAKCIPLSVDASRS
jgi:hypothetical protein